MKEVSASPLYSFPPVARQLTPQRTHARSVTPQLLTRHSTLLQSGHRQEANPNPLMDWPYTPNSSDAPNRGPPYVPAVAQRHQQNLANAAFGEPTRPIYRGVPHTGDPGFRPPGYPLPRGMAPASEILRTSKPQMRPQTSDLMKSPGHLIASAVTTSPPKYPFHAHSPSGPVDRNLAHTGHLPSRPAAVRLHGSFGGQPPHGGSYLGPNIYPHPRIGNPAVQMPSTPPNAPMSKQGTMPIPPFVRGGDPFDIEPLLDLGRAPDYDAAPRLTSNRRDIRPRVVTPPPRVVTPRRGPHAERERHHMEGPAMGDLYVPAHAMAYPRHQSPKPVAYGQGRVSPEASPRMNKTEYAPVQHPEPEEAPTCKDPRTIVNTPTGEPPSGAPGLSEGRQIMSCLGRLPVPPGLSPYQIMVFKARLELATNDDSDSPSVLVNSTIPTSLQALSSKLLRHSPSGDHRQTSPPADKNVGFVEGSQLVKFDQAEEPEVVGSSEPQLYFSARNESVLRVDPTEEDALPALGPPPGPAAVKGVAVTRSSTPFIESVTFCDGEVKVVYTTTTTATMALFDPPKES